MARRRPNAAPDQLGGNIGMPAIAPGMNRAPDTQPKSDPGQGEGENDAAIIKRALKRFERAASFEENNRKAGLDDDQMYNGKQWPDDMSRERSIDRRPCLTFNQFPTLVHQVTNDQRQARPGINISPVGDKTDVQAAKVYSGLVRFIERQSEADIAYDTAYESACRKGWGYWRVVTDYESPNTFDQSILIRRIRNAYTVYMDPTSQEPEGADARFAFVTEMVPRSDFEDEYPGAQKVPWSASGMGDAMRNWSGQNEVRVAEYFEVEHKKRRLVRLVNGHEGWFDELSDESKKLEIIAERDSFEPVVMWYKMTAVEVLDRREWPGRYIPIVRVIGDEIDLEGKVSYSGIIRHAKDAQRQYNYMRSAYIEAVALAPKAPFIMAEGQQEGHEEQWKNANRRSLPYMLYRQIDIEGKPAPPPQRQPPVQPPAGMVEGAREASQDIMSTTGVRFNANPQQERLYDESGKALHELRRAGDIGSFHYVDNLARALRHTGEIIIDLLPKVFDRKRVLTILREDGSEQQVEIDPNQAAAYKERRSAANGKTIPVFNPTMGKYGVTVTVGPSYATKRIEASQTLMEFIRAVAPAAPQQVGNILDLLAKHLDIDDADQLAARFAKMLPPQLLTPEQKDVPPQVQALIQSLQGQLQQGAQQMQKLVQALNDKNADRMLQYEKQQQDFEAKLLAVAQKADASHDAHVGSQLKDLAEGVRMLMEHLTPQGQA
ncbi:MAG TPA: portal protein [Stellaceae bacterium]|nr:portal protein [Stellaceae bacterium]